MFFRLNFSFENSWVLFCQMLYSSIIPIKCGWIFNSSFPFSAYILNQAQEQGNNQLLFAQSGLRFKSSLIPFKVSSIFSIILFWVTNPFLFLPDLMQLLAWCTGSGLKSSEGCIQRCPCPLHSGGFLVNHYKSRGL